MQRSRGREGRGLILYSNVTVDFQHLDLVVVQVLSPDGVIVRSRNCRLFLRTRFAARHMSVRSMERRMGSARYCSCYCFYRIKPVLSARDTLRPFLPPFYLYPSVVRTTKQVGVCRWLKGWVQLMFGSPEETLSPPPAALPS